MQQFVVQKASRAAEETWSTRVLTIDASNHILYLSQRRNADNMEHHCMVKVKDVKWWPHYNFLRHGVSYFFRRPALTFCIEGSTLKSGSTSLLSRAFHPLTRRVTANERASVERSYAAIERSVTFDGNTIPDKVYCRDVWMLRCMTEGDVGPLLTALRGAVMDPGCVKGIIYAAPQEHAEEPRRAPPEPLGMNAAQTGC
ncbi:hypothetical protein ABL78_2845 [Leptomonas seymouri]|uniref:Uncharacterized protein n=1 Tax=Leptomonas seymouri TaxID=5684 RepID=A0A0N0P6W0_LEPSE|nr:hypothetical protein ABL78_2845 [Leptomonas seymouri]|eukprot:KPI88069.1 hypothetical protein ABL78_2845 [Leptomonas seymouri]